MNWKAYFLNKTFTFLFFCNFIYIYIYIYICNITNYDNTLYSKTINYSHFVINKNLRCLFNKVFSVNHITIGKMITEIRKMILNRQKMFLVYQESRQPRHRPQTTFEIWSISPEVGLWWLLQSYSSTLQKVGLLLFFIGTVFVYN